MDKKDFRIGACFFLGGRKYQCTDIGTRTVNAICVSEVIIQKNGQCLRLAENDAREKGWLAGPPYSTDEVCLDECDIEACTPATDSRVAMPAMSRT